MLIDYISISNFKSFDDVTVKFNEFSVIIGANGSGKSNFFSAFKFISDALKRDVDYAISNQTGINYFYNVNIKNTKDTKFKIGIKYEEQEKIIGRRFRRKKNGLIEQKSMTYELIIEYYSKTSTENQIKNIKEIFEIDYDHVNRMENEKVILGNGTFILETKNEEIIHHYRNNSELSLKMLDEEFDWELFKLLGERWSTNRGLFASYVLPIGYFTGLDSLTDLIIYDLDPTRAKRASYLGSIDRLSQNGDNLAYVLENLLKNRDESIKLINLISEFLPFLEKYDVMKFVDNSLLSTIKENYSKNHLFPASLVSEGTINITMLILVLFFEKNNFILIEEPAKRIHPKLVEILVSKMIDVSKYKQIIVSTHNPQIVKCAGIENLIFIRRDSSGNSKIILPKISKEVKEFLKTDIGLDDLFVDDMLDLK